MKHLTICSLNSSRDDGLVGNAARFQVSLSRPTGGAVLGGRALINVNIQDDEKGVHLYVPAISVNEDAGEVVINVLRGDDGGNRVSVDYATADGTAKAGHDYTSTSGTMTFEPGEILKSFAVPILNDALPEGSETFLIALNNPRGGAVLAALTNTTVTIADTDQVVQLDAAKYYGRLDAACVQVGVLRGESDTAGTVVFATMDGAASAGVNYEGVTNELAFGPGERLKWVEVPILRSAFTTASKNFTLALRNPTGGDRLETPVRATVIITNSPLGLGFTCAAFSALGNHPTAKVTVMRTKDEPTTACTVHFETADSSARAGVDYQAVSAVLEFKPNETLKEITIPLLLNPAAKGRRTFQVTLSKASDGIPLRTATAQVNISNPGGYYPVVPANDTRPMLSDLSQQTNPLGRRRPARLHKRSPAASCRD
jgi:hypothetical protein